MFWQRYVILGLCRETYLLRGLEAPKFLKNQCISLLDARHIVAPGKTLGRAWPIARMEVALLHDARDLAAISLDNDAVDAMAAR